MTTMKKLKQIMQRDSDTTMDNCEYWTFFCGVALTLEFNKKTKECDIYLNFEDINFLNEDKITSEQLQELCDYIQIDLKSAISLFYDDDLADEALSKLFKQGFKIDGIDELIKIKPELFV